MATLTLPESAKLTQDQLVSGIIEEIITVNHMFEVMPWTNIDGNALRITREKEIGKTAFVGTGENIGDDQVNNSTFNNTNFSTIIRIQLDPVNGYLILNDGSRQSLGSGNIFSNGTVLEINGEIYVNTSGADVSIQGNAAEAPAGLTKYPGIKQLYSKVNAANRARAKDPATFESVTFPLATIFGDANVDGLIQATRSGYNDQTGVQIASKAKHMARQFQNEMINGTGANNGFKGINATMDEWDSDFQQSIVLGTSPSWAMSDAVFETLDLTLDGVLDKDQNVDYLMMNQREIRAYKAALRELGGATINETLTLPSGAEVPVYCGVPIFANNWIKKGTLSGMETRGLGGTDIYDVFENETYIYAGTFDDGSESVGMSGLTAMNNMGIQVEDIGIHHSRDQRQYRVKWYCGFGIFSRLGIFRTRVGFG